MHVSTIIYSSGYYSSSFLLCQGLGQGPREGDNQGRKPASHVKSRWHARPIHRGHTWGQVRSFSLMSSYNIPIDIKFHQHITSLQLTHRANPRPRERRTDPRTTYARPNESRAHQTIFSSTMLVDERLDGELFLGELFLGELFFGDVAAVMAA